jgi:hypothetical protein
MNHLAVIETQKVKNYVFASPALREIRGASILLDLLNRRKIPEILDQGDFKGTTETIYLGGGSGRVLFEDADMAREFCQAVEGLCRYETVNARIAAEMVVSQPGDTFVKLQSRGLRLTQQRKIGRGEALAQIAGRWIRPCSSCGALPAEVMRPEHGLHYLCRACDNKRVEVKKLYKEVKQGELKMHMLVSSSELGKRYGNDFIFTTLAQKRESQNDGATLLPQDFADIGACSRPRNYMAFIYADGNRMGETLRTLGSQYPEDKDAKAAYRAFSEIVDKSCREAAVEAVLKHVSSEEKTVKGAPARYYPAEFIMAGGDDLMLVVPAQCALEVAAEFLDLYQDKTCTLQQAYKKTGKLKEPFAPSGLTSSAGVVVAHDHYPVRHLMELAADLMKIAKHRSANEPMMPPIGTLDFMVISDSSSGRIKERRKEEYQAKSGCSLTARPYTTTQALQMVRMIRELKKADTPRTKMKKLYASLFQSPLQAQYDGLRIRERLTATGALDTGKPLAALFNQLNVFPFQSKENEPQSWQTPLSEIVEFYDYIQLKPEDGNDDGMDLSTAI